MYNLIQMLQISLYDGHPASYDISCALGRGENDIVVLNTIYNGVMSDYEDYLIRNENKPSGIRLGSSGIAKKTDYSKLCVDFIRKRKEHK